MPGVPMHCLNTIQPIVGCDAHKAIPPPPPAPPPFTPHAVVWGEGWSQKMNFLGMAVATSKATSPESLQPKPVACGWGYAVARTHDADSSHICAEARCSGIVGAGSEVRVRLRTVKLKTGDMAIAVLYAANLNLDCFDFPLPPAPPEW